MPLESSPPLLICAIYLRWWGRKRGRHLAAGEHLEHLEQPSEGIWNKRQQRQRTRDEINVIMKGKLHLHVS